jgi:twitching motility protein PilT
VRRLLQEALEFAPASLSLDRTKNVRLGLAIQGGGRFRLVVTWTSEGPALAFHCIARSLPSWQELGIPDACRHWTEERQGLILVGGVSGSGRSTTARRLAETTQELRGCSTQVIAEPIEAMYSKGNTLYFEPGLHCLTKVHAVRKALLRGSGVLLVEDLANPEDILQILEAAESGMLVIATVEALDLPDMLVRMQEGFAENERSKIRSLLARSTVGIVLQQLASIQGDVLHANFDVLNMNVTAAAHLRKNELGHLRSILTATRS